MEGKNLVIIGAGPGGYTAAFEAAQLGLNVTLVDNEASPGGVCLLRGCIPSKALLHAAGVISGAREAQAMGLTFQPPVIDLPSLNKWKQGVVDKLASGLSYLCRTHGVRFVQGRGEFVNSQKIVVVQPDGKQEEMPFDNAIIATGSKPVTLPFIPKSPRVMYSPSALSIEDIPKQLLIIGGGYIGLELGTAYKELGSAVHVVEMTPSLLPGVDKDLSAVLLKRLKTSFASIRLGTKVTAVDVDEAAGVTVTMQDTGGKPETVRFDKILVAVGRKPFTGGLGLEKTKVTLGTHGFVRIDKKMATTDPNIFAVGDTAGQPMLAHKASYEGQCAAQAIAGKNGTAFDARVIPAVVFTDPEIAWCGLTEAEARAKGLKVKAAKFSWRGSGRAVTLNRPDGVTKLIVEESTGRVLGAGLAGVDCGELISEIALAVEMGLTASDIAWTIHPHPTLSETIKGAAEHIYAPKPRGVKPPAEK